MGVNVVDLKLKKEIGAEIARRRIEMDLNKADLGKAAGKSGSYIGRIERGKEKPTMDTLFDVIAALEVSPGDFFLPWLSAISKEEESLKALRIALRSKSDIKKAYVKSFLESLSVTSSPARRVAAPKRQKDS